MAQNSSSAAVLAIVTVAMLVVGMSLFVILFGAGPAAACGPRTAGAVDVAGIAADATVAGFDREQLDNAAQIVNAAAALGLPPAAQTLGVQAAIGESTLRILAHGDGAGPDSRGLFQQRDNGAWGSLADRMNAYTSATNFFRALQAVSGWQKLEPSLAIHAVQANADPQHYARFRSAAVDVVSYLGGAAVGCASSGDAKSLATQLVSAIDDGRLRFITSDGFDYAQQVRDVAAGLAAPNCGIDARILQIISVALANFDSVGISDLNRQCTGVLAGAGTGSAHWRDGGGHAVDFTALDGGALTGCDANSVRLLQILDPLVAPGTRAGQGQCRSRDFANITGFDDTENHLHIDVAYATGGLAA